MILVDGVFDPLHHGHLVYFKEAERQFGSGLYCRVAPDDHDLVAGMKHPVLVQDMARVLLIGAFRQIEHAFLGQRDLAADIREWKPRVLVKGIDWEDRLPPSVREACRDVGCDLAFLPTLINSSTALWRGVDEKALADLERTMVGQPTPSAWTPVTPYDAETRRQVEGKHPDLIVEHLLEQGDTVLDYGCGAKAHLVNLLAERGVTVEGYDPALGGHVDMGRYQVVICREVLEHIPIREYLGVVSDLCDTATRIVYVTTRFCKHPISALSLDDRDDLDPSHITLLSQPYLRSLFVLHGMRRRADLETKLDWQHQHRCLVYEHA